MAFPSRRFQFSLRTAFVVLTLAAIASALATSVVFAAILPGLAVLALFAPLLSWLLAAITRTAHPALPRRIYIATICFTAGVGLALCLSGLEVVLAASVALVAVWFPQVLFVAFFEWCECEDRTMRAEKAAESAGPQESGIHAESP